MASIVRMVSWKDRIKYENSHQSLTLLGPMSIASRSWPTGPDQQFRQSVEASPNFEIAIYV